jgi:hypothetical protein
MTIDDDSNDDDHHAMSDIIVTGLGDVAMTMDAAMPTDESPPISPFFQDDYLERYPPTTIVPTRE